MLRMVINHANTQKELMLQMVINQFQKEIRLQI